MIAHFDDDDLYAPGQESHMDPYVHMDLVFTSLSSHGFNSTAKRPLLDTLTYASARVFGLHVDQARCRSLLCRKFREFKRLQVLVLCWFCWFDLSHSLCITHHSLHAICSFLPILMHHTVWISLQDVILWGCHSFEAFKLVCWQCRGQCKTVQCQVLVC